MQKQQQPFGLSALGLTPDEFIAVREQVRIVQAEVDRGEPDDYAYMTAACYRPKAWTIYREKVSPAVPEHIQGSVCHLYELFEETGVGECLP